MATQDRGFSWWEQAAYACACGMQFPVRRWRWLDAVSDAGEIEKVRREGPVSGACPQCQARARVHSWWVEINSERRRVVLNLQENQRADLPALLRAHIESVARRLAQGDGPLPQWLYRPTWTFAGVEVSASTEASVTEDLAQMTAAMTAEMTSPGTSAQVEIAVPKAVGRVRYPEETGKVEEDLGGAYLASLDIEEDTVVLAITLDEAGRKLWGSAALQARPVHLRTHGFPLVGVRVLASYLGQTSLIDGIVEVGTEVASRIFSRLSKSFRLHLVLHSENGSTPVRREVAARGLERNAALCIESARAALAGGEFHADAREQAMEQLFLTPMEERLEEAEHGLTAGAYRHLVSARETLAALEHLAIASQKQNLAVLLEVEGLPVGEYEAIRKRVLASSLEYGLAAPRRFWRRIVGSGVAEDLAGYAEALANQRKAAVDAGDDLDEEQRAKAWQRILDLCVQKDLPRPPVLLEVLGNKAEREGPRRGNQSMSASGEIRSRPAKKPHPTPDPSAGSQRDFGPLESQLVDPSQRLNAATRALSSRSDVAALTKVLEHIESFGDHEFLALLPSIAEMEALAVPPLHAKLQSPARHIRQAIAILLEFAGSEASIPVLTEALAKEDSKVWTDIARALGSFGSRALGPVCQLLRGAGEGPDGESLQTRVAWTMAEICLSDGVSGGGASQAAVEALAEAPEQLVALTARRGLATLNEVGATTNQVRGDQSGLENSVIRGFSRAAYEAITVPEVDVLEDADIETMEPVAVTESGRV